MLDRKFIIENAEVVKQNCVNRGVTADVDRLVELENLRREKDQEAQEFNRQANENNKLIKGAKSDEERQAIIAKGKELRAKKDAAQTEVDRLNGEIFEIQNLIPNVSHPDAPIGKNDKANLELRRGKHEPREFDFPPLDHVELGERLDLIDFEGGGRTTGHGFYFLKNEAVLLELALQRYVIGLLIAEGFTPTTTPDLARDEIVEGVGFIPRGPETQIYSIENSDLSLVATAEITLGGLYAGVTVNEEELPIRLCGISHCFRTEAGAHGRATRGLYRVHQFTKVEMFAFTTPDQSDAMHDELCAIECRIFDELGLAYRVVDTATGDLGGPAYRKFDLEAWMPGRGDGGEYGEVTSTSNCTDYQARRLNTRFKSKSAKGTKFVHTLNGTAVAISRALLAIMENYQQADGTITVPEVLR
ncbi:MAG: serine--tRNA ligase, partial [Planctomycetes bacterium]|nr:serine--tRNA ligase [Planctomycetota bacterium]